ncbi:MAG: hypothetical protein VXW22_12465 [Pseudomonadota bacterium]|jgi:hypothetical protein|nr:hypothetical protein [Pseudomonadota bacterium]
MDPDYQLEIEARISLNATPVAVEALTLDAPRQLIATVLSESCSVMFFHPGNPNPTHQIRVADDPIDIAGGGRGRAYVACREAMSVDVLSSDGIIKRINLPGRPHGIAWNGSFVRSKQKILVTCELPDRELGAICVIDEGSLAISNVLPVGRQPRGINLYWHRKQFLVANYGDHSISIVDQSGHKALATLPTAGRPLGVDVSWSDPRDIVISLDAGGVLQRMDASHFPPALSGLTALKRSTRPLTSLSPACCLPIGEDNLWIATDRHSGSLALLLSRGREFKQIQCYQIEDSKHEEQGLGQIAIATPGLSGRYYIANRKRKQLLLARMRRNKPLAAPLRR